MADDDRNIYKIETAAARELELLKKIEELEEGHSHLKQEMSKLITISGEHKKSDRQTAASETLEIGPSSFGNWRREYGSESNQVGSCYGVAELREAEYVNIMQSMGQSVHMFNLNSQIIYWNQMAQNLYGYTVAEALGKTAPDIIIGPKYSALATLIIQRGIKGESWSGEFPMRNKRWKRFTVSPSPDESGTINGAICVSTDARPFHELRPQPTISAPWRISSDEIGLDQHQPLQTAIVSKISTLASKVKSKIKTRENIIDHDGRSGGNHSFDISSKAEAWMGRKGILWPWKGNGNGNGNGSEEDNSDRRRSGRFGWPWLHYDEEQEAGLQMSYYGASMKVENESTSANNTNEASGSWFSSFGASSSDSITKVDNLDVEILWDDLIIREQIGQGSCGTVYHALWDGSDVAVKVFPMQEYLNDMIISFRKEVCLMKRLRHPNILLFMGVVTSPHHLCIVTEFLPCRSLFRLLQRNTTKLDWRRRVHMAMDIARGMNYLHHCHPPIIHLDLKSSNLLVDKNWTVKVGDFGLSSIKHETYLTTKTGINGTPQWMAPEILRSMFFFTFSWHIFDMFWVDIRSDVYSYGVVLWEITTEKIPWDNLNSMQVIGAVGFMNQRLEIPQWASLIESCCSSEAESRPTFEEILMKLKDLQLNFRALLGGSSYYLRNDLDPDGGDQPHAFSSGRPIWVVNQSF